MRLGERTLRFRTRKTLALLAYLVLEPGLHARDRLADLLWPQALDGSGRASLRTALAQINTEIGAGLVRSSRDTVSWDAPDLETDVGLLEDASRLTGDGDATPELEARLERAARLCRGELLEGLGFEDAPDFDDWLLARREIAHSLLDAVLERLSALYAASGRVNLALETAQRRVRLEPLSEAAHRSVIELHLRTGHRTAALEAYRACQSILERELGLEPDAQTRALVERFLQPGPRPPPPTQTILPSAPLTIAGSVRLVGRAEVLGRMEAAWRAGLHIFVAGEPGAGKTSLILEFAASKGAFLAHHGRPGDGAVPFSSFARGVRQALRAHPDLELPHWVRGELSRLMPELGDERLPPLSSHEDRLRLFEAVSRFDEALRGRGLFPLGDDFQFFDDSSMELIAYMFANGPTSMNASSVAAFRPEEVSIRFKEIVRQMVEAGRAVVIELPPLEPGDVGEMLSDLMPQGANLTDLGAALHRFTGGNPMFVLETVRSLAERGGLEALTAERFENRRRVAGLPRAPKVQTIIQRRLERLSTPALDLARVAAVMGEDFTLELGAKVLETPVLEVSRAAGELEAAQVWRGVRFSHDLLFETTLENIPESLRPVLHGSALDALEGTRVAAAVLAEHAFAASRWTAAFRHSLDAVEAAAMVYAHSEMLKHAERARQLFRDPPQGFDAPEDSDHIERLYRGLIDGHWALNQLEPMREASDEMLEYARQTKNPVLECRALIELAEYAQNWRFSSAERVGLLESALEIAERQHLEREIAVIQALWVGVEVHEGDDQNAIERGQRIMPQVQSLGPEYEIRCLMWLAQAQLSSGQVDEAVASYQRLRSITDARQRRELAHWDVWLGWCALRQGRIREGTELLRSGRATLLELLPNDPYYGRIGTYGLMLGLIDSGEFSELNDIVEHYKSLIRQEKSRPGDQIEDRASISLALLIFGQFDIAMDYIQEGFNLNQSLLNADDANMYLGWFNSMACTIEASKGNWIIAAKYSEESNYYLIKNGFELIFGGCEFWTMIEALLRGGKIDLARDTVRRLSESVGHYSRRQINCLRALAVLDVWDGHLESAITHLLNARDLIIPIGLPNERWTLEAKLAELFEQNGDLEKARQARTCALEITNALADGIADEVSRTVFLEFARRLIGQDQRVSASW